jgi:hypothetical protein
MLGLQAALVRPNILCAWKGPSLFIANTCGDCGDDQALSVWGAEIRVRKITAG